MGQDVDLLAISTNGLSDESHHDIVVKELKSCDGLKLASIAKAVDLKGSLLNSWMSQPLELHPAANQRVIRGPTAIVKEWLAVVGEEFRSRT